MRITFLGSGAWASALAHALSKKADNEILMYGNCQPEIDDINQNHRNSKYFDDVELDHQISATTDPVYALKGRDALVLAVPSKAIQSIVELIEAHCDTKPLLINVIKGFDPETGVGITSLVQSSIGDKVSGVVSLVGPSFAYDVIHDDPTAICAVSSDKASAIQVQNMFSSSCFRVYVQSDVVGAEIGAGMKNIIAIASGIMEGLGYKDNARAALITRGLAEITRFGLTQGAKAETFLGLTGVGDLVLTCSSRRSRNYTLGLAIGQADEASSVLAANQKTVEGVIAAKTIYEFSKRIPVDTPIVDAVYRVLYEGEKPSSEVYELMGRALKAE